MLETRRGKEVDYHVGSCELTYYSRTALQCASYGGFSDAISLLLDAQADPNLQDNEVILVLRI